jgi:hypothetical protein
MNSATEKVPNFREIFEQSSFAIARYHVVQESITPSWTGEGFGVLVGTWGHWARACRSCSRLARDFDAVRVADRKATAVVLDRGILRCIRSINAGNE